ncbi:hypothetical protein [Dickeya zeae]|uniref:hypothetical protein n=1 Tax=Dickeya zeae TaxID=204042 RepID=UPI001F30C404|nr:hypothetical protein [Dickeya zeae]
MKNVDTFLKVFMGALMHPQNQIVLDEAGIIEQQYLLSLENDKSAFQLYQTWEKIIKSEGSQGKLLLSSPNYCPSIHDYVVSSISCAITTNDKTIITTNNSLYGSALTTLARQRIYLLGISQISPDSSVNIIGKNMSYTKLDYDIAWSLERLVRLHRKGNTEDDLNDLLREYLLAKEYEIKDQTREGISASGKSAGELDIIVEHNRSLFAILEAMKLNQIDRDYITKHYKKMLINYNPLDIKRLFLITYYDGKKFDDWWNVYTEFVDSIEYRSLNPEAENTNFIKLERQETKFGNVKKLHQHGQANGEQFTIIHYAVKL